MELRPKDLWSDLPQPPTETGTAICPMLSLLPLGPPPLLYCYSLPRLLWRSSDGTVDSAENHIARRQTEVLQTDLIHWSNETENEILVELIGFVQLVGLMDIMELPFLLP